MSNKVILIDDAGWGDLILGVVIGALKLPDPRYMERRIPVSFFQSPNFERKKYLDDTVKIADEIVEVCSLTWKPPSKYAQDTFSLAYVDI